ncbi:hypothetical protein QF046_001086 [Microbacterium sp. W4I4]|uniref:hypothetical protein n=1 Tax=Microbacterium sp. W4I4 TaxID=3042295 RepID=UPI002781CE1D|nr:hypothetical protein [Microbacterium sp. W4I4]MDQ0613445.1 hypothetical protein [Microbacterium sp. W4I4]
MMTVLPVPDGGWTQLIRTTTAVAVCWAIAMFGLAAFVFSTMDPQCAMINNAHVCPQNPDPALTHLFDVRWPAVHAAWAVPVPILLMLIGIGLVIFLDTSEPWSKTGGAPRLVGDIPGVLGAGLGLLVAGPGFVQPLVALGVTGLGGLLILLGLLGVRWFRRTLHSRYARHLRREDLRERGTRTIAAISELTWTGRYSRKEGDEPVFSVTARLGPEHGAREVRAELTTPREHAPIAGGTVIVIHDGQENHGTGIDVLLESDPDGLRDPEALEKYPPAPEDSPS